MERGIRKTKRKKETLQDAANNAPDEETRADINKRLAKTKDRLRQQNAAYQEFCDENDLRPLPERLKIGKAKLSN